MYFKSQKGVTGVDIVISMFVIILTVSIVSMIYVNTNLQSRNVTRMAGATRIATNIMENIEKMSYEDFNAEYIRIKGDEPIQLNKDNYETYILQTNTTVFNTKIPKGYNIYIYGEPNYGTHNLDEDEQFDLVRDVKLVVTYKVGDTVEKVDFNAVKEREIIGEVNEPNIDIIGSISPAILEGGKNIYLVKYSDVAEAYIRTTAEDKDWYNYSNKKWAMIIVSALDEDELFDVNDKFIATNGYKRYVWIPSFFYDNEDNFSEFAYLTSSESAIKEKELMSVSNNVILKYNAFGNKRK